MVFSTKPDSLPPRPPLCSQSALGLPKPDCSGGSNSHFAALERLGERADGLPSGKSGQSTRTLRVLQQSTALRKSVTPEAHPGA